MSTRVPGEMSRDKTFRTASTFLPSDVSPNPIFNKVEDLWDNVLEEGNVLDQIALVVEQFIVDGELDEQAYLEYVNTHFSEGLDGLIDAFEGGEVVEAPMPPAPSPKVLYNRVAGCDVVDLGSGDCEKLKRCQAKKIVAIDIEPVENPNCEVVQLDASCELQDFMEQYPTSVVTSFNTLSQLESVGQVLSLDGLHICPDIDYVKQVAAFHPEADGKGSWGPFKDRENGLVGDQIAEGYVAVNTYSYRKVRLKVLGKTRVVTDVPKPQCNDIYYRPVAKDSTPKYDGQCMFLVLNKYSNVLVGRDKIGFRLERDKSPDMVLMLEKLPRTGKPTAFCLLRVMEYSGYYPFHGINNLWNFFKSVNIRIGGVRVYPPGHPDLGSYDTDGLIFRVGQLDFRFKSNVTIDITDPQKLIHELENQFGYRVKCSNIGKGLSEYIISPDGNGGYDLVFVRERVDKLSETSLDRIARMMQWI